MDKAFLIEQLASRLRASLSVARKAEHAAAAEARDGATPAEKREDARVALENSMLAGAQSARAERTLADLGTLATFRPPAFARTARVALGALVEVEDGAEGQTFFLAPVGAGIELSGPDGDGFLSVVTPLSPVGKAVLGRRVGDTIEVEVRGETREWTVTYVS
jgi:transcription elongation GreA/GreB family factor